MKYLDSKLITDAVKAAYLEICCNVDSGAAEALITAEKEERRELARFALTIMNENIRLARECSIAACQDTGMAVVFVDIGQDLHVIGDIEEAINIGVREAYRDYFRKSVLDPLKRSNTGDNTPAVIHYNIVKGDKLSLSMMAKGFGSENMSALRMLTPAEGEDGIKKFVIDTVIAAGGCACPPVIVGVGIGGTMERAAIMAKHSLLRDVGSENPDKKLDELEKALLKSINESGVGAQGLGGDTTALEVFIESFPTHIAGLPVAVNMQCHCSRHKQIILEGREDA